MGDKNKNKGVFQLSTIVQKWGNSLGVRIPKKVAEDLKIVNGSRVEIIVKDGQIILKPTEKELSLAELMSQITPDNQHEEIGFGNVEGNELL